MSITAPASDLTERELNLTRNSRALPAAIVSVLLHLAGILILITSLHSTQELAKTTQPFLTTPAAPLITRASEQRPAFSLTTVHTNPQRRTANTASDSSTARVITVQPNAIPITKIAIPVSENAEAPPKQLAKSTAVPPADDNDARAPPAPSAAAPSEPLTIDLNNLQQSIASLKTTTQSQHQQQWLNECQRYRNKHQTQDCPEGYEDVTEQQKALAESANTLFTSWVSGKDRNASLSKNMLREMDQLRPLTEDSGLLGVVARERYATVSERYQYLNPDELAARKSGGITLVAFSFGSSKLVFLGGLLSISLSGDGVKLLDDLPLGPALLYNLEKPAVHHGEKLEESDKFELQTPLFLPKP